MLEEVVRDDVDFDEGVWNRLSALLRPEDPGKYRFRTTLVRDAAYEGLPYRRRRALHNRVGETIEANAGVSTEEELGTLALHFYEGQRWDKSWDYCRKAGDRAMRIYANVEASRFYEKALVAGRRLHGAHASELAELYERRGDALYLLGDYDAADRALSAARRLTGSDPVKTAGIVVKQVNITNRTGRYRDSNLRVGRALASLKGRRGREAAASRARLMVLNGGTRFFQNRRSDSIRWGKLAVTEARKSDAKDALAQAYKLLDLAYKENGEIEKAVFAPQALKLYEELGDLRNQAQILNNQGIIAQELSDWDRALELYNRSLEILETMGDRANAVLAKYNIAEILSDQGRLDEAEPLLREAIRVWRGQGADADVAEARRELAKLFARRGEFDQADELLKSALEEQVKTGKTGEALVTTVRAAELSCLRGDGADALKAVETAIAQAAAVEGGSVYLPMLRRLRAWALMQVEQDTAADAEITAATTEARDRADRYECLLLADAFVALRAKQGRDASTVSADRAADMKRLGVVVTPSFPSEARSAVQ
jgi:tetratricopeptide (TPR) repeat protein